MDGINSALAVKTVRRASFISNVRGARTQ